MNKFPLFLAILPLFCFSKKAQKEKITGITVLKVGFDYTPPMSIDCDKFEELWNEYIDTINATNSKQLKELLVRVKKSKVDTSEYPNVDARAKIYVKYESGKVDTLCVGATTTFYYNGKLLDYGNKDLSDFMWDLSYKRK